MTEPEHGRRARRDISRRPSAYRDRPIALLTAIVVVLMLMLGLAGIVQAVQERDSAGDRGTVRRQPVARAVLACPSPAVRGSNANTQVSLAAPPGGNRDDEGQAVLTDLGSNVPRHRINGPGGLGADVSSPKVGPQLAVASGALAPGITAELVTRTDSGPGRGLSGTACVEPSNDFYFTGTSSVPGRVGWLYLTNVDPTPALVDVLLWGPRGPVRAPRGQGITVPPSRQLPLRLDGIAPGHAVLGVAVRARTGRVAAALHDHDRSTVAPRGMDWIAPMELPAKNLVIPGIPAEAAIRRLAVWTPGESDANLTVTVIGKDGSFRPAGLDALEVFAGTVREFDLSNVVPGQPMALTIASDQPVVASLRGIWRSGKVQDMIFASAAPPLTESAVVADGRGGSRGTTRLVLSAPGNAAAVLLTPLVAGGGQPTPRQIDIPSGRTVVVDPTPRGASGYALIVTPRPGSGPIYAARMLVVNARDGGMFTVSPLVAGRFSVTVPQADADVAAILPWEPEGQ